MPLKSKTFTGVSFRKILGFYYKRKRQLFYSEGTSSQTLKTLNCELFLRVVAYESIAVDKNMFKVDKKGTFQECYLGVFMISLENIFGVSDGV